MAGRGSRLNNETPKQFLLIDEKPLFFYALETYQNNPNIDLIVLVTIESYVKQISRMVEQLEFTKVKLVTAGGETRQQSSYDGLKALKSLEIEEDATIIIHDVARPLVNDNIIDNCLKACTKYEAVTTAIKAMDTIIECKDGIINKNLKREHLYQIQTPQAFRYSLIKEAHEKAKISNINDATDDAQLISLLNHPVKIVEGSRLNFKITTIEDVELFKIILNKKWQK